VKIAVENPMAGKKSFLLDMDGVLVRGRQPVVGAQEFISRLLKTETPFLVITNNPLYTPRDLSHRLSTVGLTIPEKNLFTSALAGHGNHSRALRRDASRMSSAFPTGRRTCCPRLLPSP
jgi:ribonucleotide monophosphatase NagD (HAD superfamily)